MHVAFSHALYLGIAIVAHIRWFASFHDARQRAVLVREFNRVSFARSMCPLFPGLSERPVLRKS
jgi:hypothetical protein